MRTHAHTRRGPGVDLEKGGRDLRPTADADLRRAAGWFGPFARPVTDAEKTLLAAVGIDPAVIEPWTHVTPMSPGVIRRHWTGKEIAA